MQKHFGAELIHSQGNCDLATNSSGFLYSIDEANLIYRKTSKTNEEVKIILNQLDSRCVSISSAIYNGKNLAAVASEKKVLLIQNMNKAEIKTLCQLQFQITKISFSKGGKYLGISSKDGAWLYNLQTQSLVRCFPDISVLVIYTFFSNNQQYFCSTAKDGYIRIYDIRQNTPILVHDYKILKNSQNQNLHRILQPMFNPSDTIIACPGRQFVQILEVKNNTFELEYKTSFTHQQQIFICHWINNEFLLTIGFDMNIKIWNFRKETLVLEIQQAYFTQVVNHQNTFYGVNYSGNIYKFNSLEYLSADIKNVVKQRQEQFSQQIKQKSQKSNRNRNIKQTINKHQSQQQKGSQAAEDEDQDQIDMSIHDSEIQNFIQQDIQIESVKIIEEVEVKIKSKAAKIVTCFPQQPIQRSTDYFANARFLYYNSIGCVIQKLDGTSNSIQIEYHNKSVANKRKSLFNNREMLFFDIGVNKVAYANNKEYGFYGECFWEHSVKSEDEEIQGVSLGNQWMAVATNSKIMIFDLAGNFLNSFAFDRKFVGMTGYEDTLVLAYVDSVPIFGCQNIRMNIWNINGVHEPIQNVCVSLKPLSTLKNLGFSEQGLLYSQDSKQCIRVYSISSKRWIDIAPVVNPDQPLIQRYWIFGMSNFELLTFKLPQDQYQPTAFPRSYSYSVPITIPSFHKNQIEEQCVKYQIDFGKIQWMRVVIDHERYRYNTWYRYKFARAEDNPNHYRSTTILSDEELNFKQKALDQEMAAHVANLIKSDQEERALSCAKAFVRSEKQLDMLFSLFGQANMTNSANILLLHHNQIARLQQYDLTYNLHLKKLKQAFNQIPSLQEEMQAVPQFASELALKKQIPNKEAQDRYQSQNNRINQNKFHKLLKQQKPSIKKDESQLYSERKSQEPETQTQSEITEVRNPFLRVCNPIEYLEKLQENIDKKKEKALVKVDEKAKKKPSTHNKPSDNKK